MDITGPEDTQMNIKGRPYPTTVRKLQQMATRSDMASVVSFFFVFYVQDKMVSDIIYFFTRMKTTLLSRKELPCSRLYCMFLK